MYLYRALTKEQQAVVVAQRKRQRVPWHEPPHFSRDKGLFLITAACYEHQPILSSAARRDPFRDRLIGSLREQSWAKVQAWAILPNHYHLLAECPLAEFRQWIGRLHNGTATEWNRENDCAGRKVWHRFSDRAVRNDRHYWATVNYIHFNPVKHGLVAKAHEWKWSSVHEYLAEYGREELIERWKEYPVDDYGRGWDD